MRDKSTVSKPKTRERTALTKRLIAEHRWTSRSDHSQTPFEVPLNPEFVGYLGSGRAAEVHLVRDTATGELYAEKLFQAKESLSEMGRNLIYLACFQAPFPYHTKEHAIRASKFRRNVLKDLTEFWFGRSLIADAYYTRWDETAQGYILGTEYIKGRGPKPGVFDRYILRTFLKNYPLRFLKRLVGIRSPKIEVPSWEIDEVITQLDALKDKFRQSGFMGSEWQVNKMLSTPTSNLLRDEKGRWVLVDVESGMPALIVLDLLWTAIKTGSFPLFDDVNFDKLNEYLSANKNELTRKLGLERYRQLRNNVKQLQYHTEAWKSSEPAIFRNKHRLLTDGKLRKNIRKGFAEHWSRSGKISPEKATQIEKSSLPFFGYLCLDSFKSIGSSIAAIFRSLRNIAVNSKQSILFALRLAYDEACLIQFSETYVNERIDRWQKAGRLTAEEAEALRPDMDTPAQIEYLRGLGFHIGLKPIITLLLFSYAMWILHDPEFWGLIKVFLATIWVGPAIRTIYTLFRIVKTRGKGISHGMALLVGALPKVGNAAYPIQMTATNPGLASFLQRQVFSIFGCHFPLFGGTDSRLEHFFIRLADFRAAILYELANLINGLKSILLLAIRPLRRSHAQKGS
ncbi:MAG: hypothetical protein HQ553_14800 [Chloroflexi bacterium]|nr:hypothetical protein [Chloroflexota bacterium]